MASVVTNGGKGVITGRIKGTGTEPNYVAWGTGAGTAAITDAALFTAGSEARTAGTSTQVTTTTTNDTYQVVGNIVASGAKTITEVGLFTDVSAGTLYMHADFTGIALASGDSITFTIKTQLT